MHNRAAEAGNKRSTGVLELCRHRPVNIMHVFPVRSSGRPTDAVEKKNIASDGNSSDSISGAVQGRFENMHGLCRRAVNVT